MTVRAFTIRHTITTVKKLDIPEHYYEDPSIRGTCVNVLLEDILAAKDYRDSVREDLIDDDYEVVVSAKTKIDAAYAKFDRMYLVLTGKAYVSEGC